MKTILLLLCLALSLVACRRPSGSQARTLQAFQSLGAEITLDEVVARFGPTDRPASPPYILIYRLVDGTEVFVGISHPAHQVYFQHVTNRLSLSESGRPR